MTDDPLIRAIGNDPYDGDLTDIGITDDDVIDTFHMARLADAVADDPDDPEMVPPELFLVRVLGHYAECEATPTEPDDIDLRGYQ